MDTTTPQGEFLFNIFGSLAQYERALIKEGVTAGLRARKHGSIVGGRDRVAVGSGPVEPASGAGRAAQPIRVNQR